MTTEHTLTNSGELKESETIVKEEIFSEDQIDDKINALADEITVLQAERAEWQSRILKLAELQAE